jgi:ppGpp synthetase/RelA/SpoT-type nucleotidyltranferase
VLVPAAISANALKRLGQALRDGRLEPGTPQWEAYAEYLAECDLLRAIAEERVRRVLGESVHVTGRTKSTDTLRDKLLRTPAIQLPSIDDVVGIRAVGEFTLDEQDSAAAALRKEFPGEIRIRDRRIDPSSGYRALHVIARVDGTRVEIQIRSRLQAEWADLFERLADRWGRQIRYGEGPDPDEAGGVTERAALITELKELSLEYITPFEEAVNRRGPDPEPPSLPTRHRRRGPRSREQILLDVNALESRKGLIKAYAEYDRAIADWRDALLRIFDALAAQADLMP